MKSLLKLNILLNSLLKLKFKELKFILYEDYIVKFFHI